jgi:hypothetical protein
MPNSEEEMKGAFETLFWGPMRVIKAVLPSMRARKSGTIVYNSSIFGMMPMPSGPMYSCPKAAGDLLQQCIGADCAAFNIRTITLLAGLFRTQVLQNQKMPAGGFSQDYMNAGGVTGEIFGAMGSMVGDSTNLPGDPVKFGQRVVEIVDGTGYGKGLEKQTRFLFGRDAATMADELVEELQNEFKASKELANSTDYDDVEDKAGVYVVRQMIAKHKRV